MSANDATRTVADTSPLTPEGVCLTSEGDILVTMADPEDENATGLVKMFSMRGKVKRKYEYDSSGERLFKLPFRVAQNKNSDICVLDSLDTEHGVLHTISSEGHTQFIYKGVKSLQHPLYAADIVCDDICNIILMDAKNHHIHLLDSAGNFLKFLTRDEGDRRHSLSLALSGDILWAGGHNGYLSVYKYTNNSWFIFTLYTNWTKNKSLMKSSLGTSFKIKSWKCLFFTFLKLAVLTWSNKIKERKII